MKVLLVNSLRYTALSGAAIAHRGILRKLAERGHRCRVVCPLSDGPDTTEEAAVLELSRIAATPAAGTFEGPRFRDGAVELACSRTQDRLLDVLDEELSSFAPDVVIAASEIGKRASVLERLLNTCREKVVLITYTLRHLPFGPYSLFPSGDGTDRLRSVPRLVTVSYYVKDYLKKWGDLDATVFHFPAYGSGPFRDFGKNRRVDSGAVSIANPCLYKGLPVFLKVAEALPGTRFLAIPGWGSTAEDIGALSQLRNVDICLPDPSIERVLRHVSTLMVPSLMDETFGQIVIEAMLRGIPVIASDNCGLREAMLGVDYVLPLQPLDVHHLPNGDTELRLPEQRLDSWIETVQRLSGSEATYRRVSTQARKAALEFYARLPEEFDEFCDFLAMKRETP